jgi:hypothetical protein
MSQFKYSAGAPTKGMLEALSKMAGSRSGQLERRRGNLNASCSQAYWNNYWTVPEEPATATWYVQGHTVAGLAHRGFITLTHTRKGSPSRYVINKAGRRALNGHRR